MSTAPTGTAIDPPSPDSNRLLVRWFVQYNPLFTMSALCVLGGVLLLSQHLQSSTRDVSLGLSVVVELYQWLLIGTAGLLYRRLNEHRPGVILGIIALVFLADPTLQLSALATAGHVGACVVWVVLVAAKLHALQHAFCLRLSASARAVPVLAAACVAALPNARLFDDVADAVPAALAVGIFLLGLLATMMKPTVASTRALGELGEEMLPRLVRAAVVIGVVGALYQGGNAIYALGIGAILPALAACFLVVVLRLRAEHEPILWGAAFTAVIIFNGAGLLLQLGLPLLAVSLLIASRNHAPRVLSAGLLAAAVPSLLVLRHDLSLHNGAHVAIAAVVSLALMAVLVQRRAPSALLAFVLLHHRTIPLLVLPTLKTEHTGTWGLVLVGAGFGLLPLGVYAHRRLSRSLALDDAHLAACAMAAPTSSASPGVS